MISLYAGSDNLENNNSIYILALIYLIISNNEIEEEVEEDKY